MSELINSEGVATKDTTAASEKNKSQVDEFNSYKQNQPDYKQGLAPQDKLLLLGALAIGILFVILFYDKFPGISVPIFTVAFYGVLLVYVRPVMNKNCIFGWFLCMPVFALSLTYLLFDNNVFKILDLLVLPAIILLQTAIITGVNIFKWYSPGIIIDLLYGVFYRCFAHISKPFGILSVVLKKNKGEAVKKSTGFRIITGLLISLPILLILLSLLSSADMVLGNLVDRIPRLFEDIDLGGMFGRTIVGLIIFFISFSYIWSLGHGDKLSDNYLKNAAETGFIKNGRWDLVTITTITAAVDLLYVVFVIIQFTYLFGRLGLPEGLTYAEYARRGFFELILVTLMNIGFLGGTLTFTGKGSKTAVIVFRIFNTVMIGCTFVMLYSAHFRMALYEEAYGYTFLRVMTQAFMVFLFVLFAITLVKVWVENIKLLKPYIVVAILAFTVVNYINVDTMIVRKNIERYHSTKIIDVSYFWSLSNDAVPEIMKLGGDLNPSVATEVRELLDNRKNRLEEDKDWRSFNLADYRARKLLEK